MTEQRHLIWSNYDLDYEDWRDDLEEDHPELTVDERMALMYEINNCLLYRTYKPGVRDSQIDLLKEKLYYGKAVRSDITRITRRLGDEIGKVYGWDFPKPRQAVSVER